MANTTYVFSAYPDGSTVTSTCSFKATPTNKKGNIIKNSTKGVKLGSTDVKAIYKGDIQIWPEVKTLYFVNIQIYTQTEYKGTSGDPHAEYISEPLLSGAEFGGNHSEPGWNEMNNYSGSDFIQGKRRRGSMWELVNTFGTFKYRQYKRNYFVCDIQDITYHSFNVGSSKINIPFSSINIKWEADDGTVTSINTSTTRFSFESWCYMQGTKFYYSPGWVANISSRIDGGIKRAGGFELPEKPQNATITRTLPTTTFNKASGTSANAVETNQTVNGVSGRTILKRYAKSFGFEYKDPYYASSPYTSYALYNNGTYIPYRYIFKGCSWNPSCVSYTLERKVLFNNGSNLTFWAGDARNSDTEISTPTYIGNQLDNYATNGILTTSMAFLCLSKNYTLNRTLYSGSSGSSNPKKAWAIQTNAWYLEWYKLYQQRGLPDKAGTITGNIGLTGNVPITYTITNQRYLASNNHNTSSTKVTSITFNSGEYDMYRAKAGNDHYLALRSFETDWFYLPTQATNGPDCKYNLNVNLTMNIGCHGVYYNTGRRWFEAGSNYFRFHVHVVDYNNNEIGWIQGNYNLAPHMVGGYSNDSGWYNFEVPLNDCNIIIDRSKNEETGDRRVKLKIELDSNDFNNFTIRWGNGSNQINLFKKFCRLRLTNISNINVYKVPLALNTTINFSSAIAYSSLHFIKKTSSASAFNVTNTYSTANANGNNLINVLKIAENSSNLIKQDPVVPTSIYGFSYYETISDTVNLIYSYYTIRKLRTLRSGSDFLLSHNGNQPLYHIFDNDTKYWIRLQTSENSKSINAETFISSVTRNYTLK